MRASLLKSRKLSGLPRVKNPRVSWHTGSWDTILCSAPSAQDHDVAVHMCDSKSLQSSPSIVECCHRHVLCTHLSTQNKVNTRLTQSPDHSIMASPSDTNPDGKGRLLLVSNRLPITVKRSDEGTYDFSMSSGGLVSGLSGLSKSTKFQWYGWPGLQVPKNEISLVKDRLWKEYGAVPVFMDDELADRHYNGFSSVLHNPDLQEIPSLTCCRLDSLAPLPLPSR